MLKKLREQLAALRTQRQQLIAQQNTIVEACEQHRGTDASGREVNGRDLTADEQTSFDGLVAQVRALDTDQIGPLEQRIRDLEEQEARSGRADDVREQQGGGQERRIGGFRVTYEERTYAPHKDEAGRASWFCDMFRAQTMGDTSAGERLRRHGQEMVTEKELTARAQTTGGAGGLVVPQYLPQMAALALRTGRPFANAVQGMQLPSEGMTINVPRGLVGMAVASQATENTVVQNTDETWTTIQVPVVTIAGQQDVSRQLLERGSPGIDQLIYADGAGAYHAELDRQTLNGTGTNNQHIGVFQVSGAAQSTAYGAALSPVNFTKKVAGGIGVVASTGTVITPNLLVSTPMRWAWLNSLSDGQNRPLVVPGIGGPMNILALNMEPGGYSGDGDPANADTFSVPGSMQGLPWITDANVPANVGTNVEDLVGIFDRTKLVLWEDGDKQPKNLRFEQTLGNQLTVKLVIYGYSAFMPGRYPAALAKLGGVDTVAGNGQIAPALF